MLTHLMFFCSPDARTLQPLPISATLALAAGRPGLEAKELRGRPRAHRRSLEASIWRKGQA